MALAELAGLAEPDALPPVLAAGLAFAVVLAADFAPPLFAPVLFAPVLFAAGLAFAEDVFATVLGFAEADLAVLFEAVLFFPAEVALFALLEELFAGALFAFDFAAELFAGELFVAALFVFALFVFDAALLATELLVEALFAFDFAAGFLPLFVVLAATVLTVAFKAPTAAPVAAPARISPTALLAFFKTTDDVEGFLDFFGAEVDFLVVDF